MCIVQLDVLASFGTQVLMYLTAKVLISARLSIPSTQVRYSALQLAQMQTGILLHFHLDETQDHRTGFKHPCHGIFSFVVASKEGKKKVAVSPLLSWSAVMAGRSASINAAFTSSFKPLRVTSSALAIEASGRDH
jgi:hypothetical protein